MPIAEDSKTLKHSELVAAAHRVFARQGYHRTQMQAVADEAGVGKGTIYEYFRSKDQLFLAVFHQLIADVQAEMLAIQKGPGTYEEKVALMLQRIFERFREGRFDCFMVLDFIVESYFHEEKRESLAEIRAIYANVRAFVAQIIRAGQAEGAIRAELDAETHAAVLAGLLDGLILQWALNPEALDIARLAEHLADIRKSGVV